MNSYDFLELFPRSLELDLLNDKRDLSIENIQALSILLSRSYLENPRKIALVLPTLYDAQNLIDGLNDFIPQEQVVFFPFDEVLRIESLGTSVEMREERLNALASTLSDSPNIFVTHSAALIRYIRSKATFASRVFTLSTGDDIARKELIEKVENAGYRRVNKVTHCFEYALRGEVFDIWSANSLSPVRLEFFDETIEEIREFSPETELSNTVISKVTIIPTSEFTLAKGEAAKGFEALDEAVNSFDNGNKLAKEELLDKINLVKERVSLEGLSETDSRYLAYFASDYVSVLDFLESYDLFYYHPHDLYDVANHFKTEEEEFFNDLMKLGQALPKERIYQVPNSVFTSVAHVDILESEGDFKLTDIPYHNENLATVTNFLTQLLDEGYEIRACLSENRLRSFEMHLDEEGIAYENYPSVGKITIYDHPISMGFMLPKRRLVYLSKHEIFGLAKQSGKFLTRFKEAKVIKKYEDLEVGDYVVHEDYGIGQFIGVSELNGLDYLKIQYAGDSAFLYVPLSKFKLIRKYAGKEGIVPKLDEMGGTSWARRKERIRNRVSYLADKLLDIYAERMAKPGYSFMSEEEMESTFANSFPYQLTISQAKAWQDISNDMESPHPMDRLLAGDVGFGKTELAFRACYKAILSHKQAAILCPTTILAKQHHEVATKRFKGYGVEIAVLSRFTKKKELDRQIKRIKEGKVHLVIGTHKLLGAGIEFSDLGLLVIDEEQRFGVTHKERIKELTTNIDILTLTATPIPRTLQMSLLNVKSLSLLTEAPQNRMPIKTYVTRYDKGLVKEVISRELGRGGQVYYLHNRIESIYTKAREIQTMFPNATIKVVHGALDADEISDIMNDFYDGNTDVLVCTTIIETGLDIPNVNTLVVENADHFGLAQLYQIKGRVGRSNRLAYAYLFYQDYKNLSEQGQKRLKAIKEFTELGSGYKIANQDLSIRGAGDILGKEQAGFIDSIGYDSYMRLLDEVMKEKKVAESAASDTIKHNRYELSFSLDSHIPPSYAEDADRIAMYQELSDIHDRESLANYKSKIRDVYGPFPEELENLFIKREIEIYLDKPFVDSFIENIDKYTLTLTESFIAKEGLLPRFEKALALYSSDIYVRFIRKKIVMIINRTPDYLLTLYNILTSIDTLTDD